MKKTRIMAISAMLTALGFVVLLLGSVFDMMELSAAALASLCVLLAVLELNRRAALAVFAATALLGILLLPTKTTAIYYAVLFGLYPFVKALAERVRMRVVEWSMKLGYCAATFALTFWAVRAIVAPELPNGWYLAALFFVGAVAFVLFDIALTGMIGLYDRRLRGRLFRKN